MLLGGLDMGAVFAPIYNREFKGWIDRDMEELPKDMNVYPDYRMVAVLQNRNIFLGNPNSRKDFDVDCSDGEINWNDVGLLGTYNWNGKLGDKVRKSYMKYISSMFKSRFQDCVQRYSGLSDYDSLCIKANANYSLKLAISTKKWTKNNEVLIGELDKKDNLVGDKEYLDNRFGWGLVSGFVDRIFIENMFEENMGYSMLEWRAICGMLDATYYIHSRDIDIYLVGNRNKLNVIKDLIIDRNNNNILNANPSRINHFISVIGETFEVNRTLAMKTVCSFLYSKYMDGHNMLFGQDAPKYTKVNDFGDMLDGDDRKIKRVYDGWTKIKDNEVVKVPEDIEYWNGLQMSLWSWYQYSRETGMVGFTNDRECYNEEENNTRTYDF